MAGIQKHKADALPLRGDTLRKQGQIHLIYHSLMYCARKLADTSEMPEGLPAYRLIHLPSSPSPPQMQKT